jgi:hypothetical protein
MGLAGVDEILVMEGGHVVERGRHHDLVRADGWYARQWGRELDCELSVRPRSPDRATTLGVDAGAEIILPG